MVTKNSLKLTGRYWNLTILILLTAGLFSYVSSASGITLLRGESMGMSYQVEQVSSELGTPWGMAFITPDQLLFTEQRGRVGIVNLDTKRVIQVTGAPTVRDSGQGGLLDVAVPDNYRSGGWIYFTYSKPVGGKGVTTLARARLQGYRLARWQDLLVTRSATSTGRHFGSRIAFDDTGHIYFSVGDRGVRPNGQDLTTHAGSILRLNRDGTLPESNPFSKSSQALPEIWSFGHRNPQGITFDKKNGRLWSIEHGPRGGDEINLILPGRNYGWPVISYGKEYWGPVQVGEGTAKKGMEQPVKVYTPSIAPGSLILYSGKAFPAWRSNLFAGALKLMHLNRIELDTAGNAIGEERLALALKERIRALVEGPRGWIYFSTDSGKIMRLRPRP